MLYLEAHCAAFAESRCIASGLVSEVVVAVARHLREDPASGVLIFDDATGQQVDFDLRGSDDDIIARLAKHPFYGASSPASKPRTGPGRPKLGVVSREISLLPRHWTWLEAQPNGASAALRRLIDDKRKQSEASERGRNARNAAARFITAVAGDRPGFEEATRALFAEDDKRLRSLTQKWPRDIRDHLARLLAQ